MIDKEITMSSAEKARLLANLKRVSAEANKALSQLRFGIATSSTRSLIAFFGYMRWRERFTEEAKNLHVV